MEKYKVCPVCKSRNEPTVLECVYCEADLASVRITDEETESLSGENAGGQFVPPVKMARVCECGAVNPSNARKCVSCGEDISDIAPVPGMVEGRKSPACTLSSLDGQYVYKMAASQAVIGRENIMGEYLSAKSYVSRAHARLSLEEGEPFIENLSSTNYTYVNNRKILGKTRLRNGDEVALGGMNIGGRRQEQAAYFMVRIG